MTIFPKSNNVVNKVASCLKENWTFCTYENTFERCTIKFDEAYWKNYFVIYITNTLWNNDSYVGYLHVPRRVFRWQTIYFSKMKCTSQQMIDIFRIGDWFWVLKAAFRIESSLPFLYNFSFRNMHPISEIREELFKKKTWVQILIIVPKVVICTRRRDTWSSSGDENKMPNFKYCFLTHLCYLHCVFFSLGTLLKRR